MYISYDDLVLIGSGSLKMNFELWIWWALYKYVRVRDVCGFAWDGY